MKISRAMGRILVLAACCLLCLSPKSHADGATWTNPTYGPWHSATIGGGGYIQYVVLCPSDPKRVYAYGDMCGAFRSDDGGQNWRMIHGSLPTTPSNYEFSGLSVDPRDANRILVLTGSKYAKPEGVYASDDGGATWTKTLTGAWAGNALHKKFGTLIARDPKNPDVVLVASLGIGIWRSEDSGKTWADCGAKDLYPADIRFDRAIPGRVYLCAIAADDKFKMKAAPVLGGGFFVSNDGGKSWTKLSDDSPTEIVQDPKVPATFYGISHSTTVLRSSDSCATWQPFADGLPATPETKIDTLGAGPDFVLVATWQRGDFYRLDCGQATWKPVARTGWDKSSGGICIQGMACSMVVVDPHDLKHWFSNDICGVNQTWDSGSTFMSTNHGIEVTVNHDIRPDLADPTKVYLGMADAGGFWSDDAGQTYHEVLIPGGGNQIKMISQSPVDLNTIYEVGSSGYGAWQSDQVYVSSDRGRHFDRVKMKGTGFPEGWIACDSIVADPKDANTAYVTNAHQIGENGGGGVYKTTDRGKSWTWMGQGLPAKAWYFQDNLWVHGPELAASADGSIVAVSSHGGNVFHFDSSAKTWLSATGLDGSPHWSVASDASTPGRYLLCGYAGVYMSTDSGATWRKIYSSMVHFAAADPRVKDRFAIGTTDGIALSTDAGATWTRLDKQLPYRYLNNVAFAGNSLIVGTGGSGMFWYDLGK